jgi:Plavaka transposase
MQSPSQGTTVAMPENQGTLTSSVVSRVRKILNSTRNIFGLFRQYNATQFPKHDPVNTVTSDDLLDTSPDASSSLPANSYSPYPNQSSFLLGEWYWNDGVTKSQSSFKNLLKIIGHPEFRPEDVAGTNWRRIDAQLGGTRGDNNDGGDGWEDEDDGNVSGWVETPIKIKVPFHRNTLQPGQEEFVAGKLHHRKLVSVIREKILRPSSHPHLHFEPYKLFWQPNSSAEPVRVHGELYTSDAFIDAHNDLQESPGEPGCDLPRVIVGLMFASDGTNLMDFSNAKLWPVYLAFGNESKDRRSKPSCHAFEHVAYFETVSTGCLVSCVGRVESLV